MRRHLVGTAAAAACAFLALASPAPGAWTAPQTIPGAPSTPTPGVAIDAVGNAVAVFVDSATGTGGVRFADRPAGGAWSPSAPIPGATNAQAPPDADSVVVKVNPAGAAVALWTSAGVIKTAYRAAPGSAWSVQTPPIADFDTNGPRVAIDAAGNAAIGWYDFDTLPIPDAGFVRSAYRSAASGTWSTAEDVAVKAAPSGTDALRFFDIAFASNGLPAVAYADEVERTGNVRFRTAADTWGGDAALPVAEDIGFLAEDFRAHLGPMPGGGLVAAWIEFQLGSPAHEYVRAAVKPAAGGFGAATTLHEVTYDVVAPLQELRLATSAAGDAIVGWLDRRVNPPVVRTARRPAGASFEAQQGLSSAAAEVPFDVAIGAGGAHVAAWRQSTANVARGAASATAPWAPVELMHPAPGALYKPGGFTMAGSASGVIAGWSFEDENSDRPSQTVLFGGVPGGAGGGGDTGGGGGGGGPAPSPVPLAPSGPTPSLVPVLPGRAAAPRVGRTAATCRRARRRARCRIRLTLTVDRAATVKVVVARLVKGRTRAAGTLTRRVRAGRTTITLPDRLRGRRLPKGRYVVTVMVGTAPPQTVRVNVT